MNNELLDEIRNPRNPLRPIVCCGCNEDLPIHGYETMSIEFHIYYFCCIRCAIDNEKTIRRIIRAIELESNSNEFILK